MSVANVQSAPVSHNSIESDRNDLVLLGVASLGDLEGNEKTIRSQLQDTGYLYFAYFLSHEIDQTVPALRMGYLPYITHLMNRLGDEAADTTVSQMAKDAPLSVAVETANNLIAGDQNYDLTALTIAAWLKRTGADLNEENFADLSANETFVAIVGKYKCLLEQKGVNAAMEAAMITKLCAGIPNIEVIDDMKGRYGLVQDPVTNIITLAPKAPATSEAPSASRISDVMSHHAGVPRMDMRAGGSWVSEPSDAKTTLTADGADLMARHASTPRLSDMSAERPLYIVRPPVDASRVADLMTMHAGVPRAEVGRLFQAEEPVSQSRPTPSSRDEARETPYVHCGSYGIG